MGAALSIFVILSLSVFVMRVASVALRFTGLTDSSARFQALSAFTGTGFTTSEAETVVNYPVRRRIIGILMIIGNMGFVTVFATLVVSLVQTDGEVAAVIAQLVWLVGGLVLLWFLMLSKTADRILCTWIGKFLESTTFLGRRSFHRLLQIGDGFSICEHAIPAHWSNALAGSARGELERLDLTMLIVRSPDGEQLDAHADLDSLTPEQTLILFGPDHAHDSLGDTTDAGKLHLAGKIQ